MPAPIKRKKQRGPRSGFGCLTWVGSRQRWGVQQQFRQPNGKTTRRIVHWFEREESATREQAQAAFAKWLERAKVEGLSYTKGQALDIATLCAEFAEKGQELFRRGDKVSSAWDFVKASADQWANMQGKLRIADYSGQDFRAFRDALDRLASSGAYRALQTREGVNRRLQKCIRIARWGVSMGLCPPSFPQVLDSVEYLQTGNAKAKESEARMPCSESDFLRALEWCHAKWVPVLILQRWGGGARPSEILSLHRDELTRHGDIWIAVKQEHKTASKGIHREIVFSPAPVLQDALERLISQCSASDPWLFSLARWQSEGQQKTPVKWTKPYPSERMYRTALASACKLAQIDTFTPYQICHMRLTEIAGELGEEYAQATRGHTSATMTARYTKLAQEKRNRRLAIEAAGVGVDTVD